MLNLNYNKIGSGIYISLKGFGLPFKNFILFTYGFPLLFIINIVRSLFLEGSISALVATTITGAVIALVSVVLIIMAFLSCCLARHTMYLLRQQSTSIAKTFAWVLRNCIQLFMLIFIFVVLFVLSRDIFMGMANTMRNPYLALPILLFVTSLLGLFISIVSTEKIGTLQVIERLVRIVWKHFATYLSMYVTTTVSLVLLILFKIALHVFFRKLFGGISEINIYSGFLVLVFIMQVIVSSTIFYFEFYIKREHE